MTLVLCKNVLLDKNKVSGGFCPSMHAYIYIKTRNYLEEYSIAEKNDTLQSFLFAFVNCTT